MFRVTAIILFAVFSTYCSVIKVKGFSDRDIQLAVNRCRHLDTVLLSSGVYNFGSSVEVPKGVTILGTGRDRTFFNRVDKSDDEFWFFRIDGAHRFPFRVSGISFKAGVSESSGGIFIFNGGVDFQIDNCRFERLSRRAVEIRKGGRGVIYQNIFIDNWPTSVVVYGNGDQEWNEKLTLGTAEAVYVEDNFFSQSSVPDKNRAHHIASNNGSRYVFRYNVIQDGNMASHAIDAHGNKFGWKRGSRSYEIYGNTISAVHRWAGINIRGGDGVIFDNHFVGSFISPIHLMHEGRNGDGNCAYPCEDQIRQLYIWNNECNDSKIKVFVRHSEVIAENRDYWLIKRSGYRPYIYPHPLRGEQKGVSGK